jgi:hypothetical protein
MGVKLELSRSRGRGAVKLFENNVLKGKLVPKWEDIRG